MGSILLILFAFKKLFSGRKPLYYALKIIGNSKDEIVRLLVNEGAIE